MSPNDKQSDQDQALQTLEKELNLLCRRLASAHMAGRGVNLSAREVQLLGLSMLGEWWNIDDDEAQ